MWQCENVTFPVARGNHRNNMNLSVGPIFFTNHSSVRYEDQGCSIKIGMGLRGVLNFFLGGTKRAFCRRGTLSSLVTSACYQPLIGLNRKYHQDLTKQHSSVSLELYVRPDQKQLAGFTWTLQSRVMRFSIFFYRLQTMWPLTWPFFHLRCRRLWWPRSVSPPDVIRHHHNDPGHGLTWPRHVTLHVILYMRPGGEGINPRARSQSPASRCMPVNTNVQHLLNTIPLLASVWPTPVYIWTPYFHVYLSSRIMLVCDNI